MHRGDYVPWLVLLVRKQTSLLYSKDNESVKISNPSVPPCSLVDDIVPLARLIAAGLLLTSDIVAINRCQVSLVYSYIWESRIYFHSLGENIRAAWYFFTRLFVYLCAQYRLFVHRYIHKIPSKHVLPSLMEALFNVPAQSALPNKVRSDKTQVHVNQVLLPVSYGPGATLGRTCPPKPI